VSDRTYARSRVASEPLSAIHYSHDSDSKIQSVPIFFDNQGVPKMLMKNPVIGCFPRTRQALADKAAARAQNGLRIAQDTARKASEILSTKLAARAGDAASNATDSLVVYRKKHPAKALAIAAAAGAVLYAMIKVFTPSRD
jgi:ElaB/YqjD/DUF883 family membrane-anchored ribosome-binding protein